MISGEYIAAQTTEWESYYPQDSAFTISFPQGDLMTHVDTVHTEIGDLFMHKVINKSRINRKEVHTVISWNTYPAGTLHSDSTETLNDFWRATIEQSVDAINGELVYDNAQRVGVWPAHIWRVNHNDGLRMDNLAVLKEKTFYLLQFSAPNSLEYTQLKERFFRSFYLVK